ncbi:hypothetical protein [Kitasatospora sp. NPDC088134]|uniref:hypothetical protein n=1 Tax=Kitasatospora sp. NPDC088134 TaxID=3364071 RepID=UPI003812D9AD
MSVSVYYSARRATALTAAETAAVERIAADSATAFPFPDEESLCLYEGDSEHVVHGSTKLPSAPERTLPALSAVLGSVTALRRAVPDADWHVHLDDLDVPWDETEGYTFPGLSGTDLW